MKRVRVEISGQRVLDGDKERIQDVCRGLYNERSQLLTYSEKPEGSSDIITRIRPSENGVTVEKSGGLSTVMTFVPGETTKASYHTGVWGHSLEIETELAAAEVRGVRICFELIYSLWIDGTYAGKTQMKIEAV